MLGGSDGQVVERAARLAAREGANAELRTRAGKFIRHLGGDREFVLARLSILVSGCLHDGRWGPDGEGVITLRNVQLTKKAVPRRRPDGIGITVRSYDKISGRLVLRVQRCFPRNHTVANWMLEDWAHLIGRMPDTPDLFADGVTATEYLAISRIPQDSKCYRIGNLHFRVDVTGKKTAKKGRSKIRYVRRTVPLLGEPHARVARLRQQEPPVGLDGPADLPGTQDQHPPPARPVRVRPRRQTG